MNPDTTPAEPLATAQEWDGATHNLFLGQIQSRYEDLPLPGDTVKEVSFLPGGSGLSLLFKNGRRVTARIRQTEITQRTVEQLVEQHGYAEDGSMPAAVVRYSEEAIRRHRRMRQHAKKLALAASEQIEAVVSWAAEEFADAVIDGRTYPEIRDQIEERLSGVVKNAIDLQMVFHEGVEPGTILTDGHAGYPSMFAYPEFLEPVFANRPHVDRTPPPLEKLEGAHLESSIARQMCELHDEFMFRDLDASLLRELHGELCRILQPLSDVDLKDQIHIRVAVTGDKPDVIYPPELQARINDIMDRHGDPRVRKAVPVPSAEEKEAFAAQLAGKVVKLHEISPITGGAGLEWSIPLERLIDVKPMMDKPFHSVVGYTEEGEPEVLWQIVHESSEEIGQIVAAIAEAAQRAVIEQFEKPAAGVRSEDVAKLAGIKGFQPIGEAIPLHNNPESP